MSKRRLVRAVQRKDLYEFLKNADLLDDLASGTLKCDRCDRMLTEDEIASFVVKGLKVIVQCSRPDCSEIGSEKDIAD